MYTATSTMTLQSGGQQVRTQLQGMEAEMPKKKRSRMGSGRSKDPAGRLAEAANLSKPRKRKNLSKLDSPSPDDLSLKIDYTRVQLPKGVQIQQAVRDDELDPRLFGIKDCPIYYPTIAEFKDPMAYIRKIGDEGGAKEVGICKIVPPTGWRPPFVIDEDKFRFTTRLQKLNTVDASNRAHMNLLEQLQKFHMQQGRMSTYSKPPVVRGAPLNMWELRKTVNSEEAGGCQNVNRLPDLQGWEAVAHKMNYPSSECRVIAHQLREAYRRIIYPYEIHMSRLGKFTFPELREIKNATTGSDVHDMAEGQEQLAPTINTVPDSPLAGGSVPGNPTAPSSPETPRTPRARIASGLSEASSEGRRSSLRTQAERFKKPLPATPEERAARLLDAKARDGEVCEICLGGEDATKTLICDGCDRAYHMYCLEPPMKDVPQSDWYCDDCLNTTGANFGFEEGHTHSLGSFQQVADAFKSTWFRKHPPLSGGSITAKDIEQEFWRLVESPQETVEIEYGADVHSTIWGSGFPSQKTSPNDPYATTGWNLGIMPTLVPSLLRWIESDISGMTVPWLYIGMCFSTFCWHNEDHFTYSVNYMHWGETKTWYGVPGVDAEKLEKAMQKLVPEMFEHSPDLLGHLTTLVNPKRLVEQGVRVSACDQQAGEFVITFPKAYHAGFNHGVNFNEAVNFALPDWLDNGLVAVKNYRALKKSPVFSHDELLIRIVMGDSSIATALWLAPAMDDLVAREIEERRNFRMMGLANAEILDESDLKEDTYNCSDCKTFCYLSQVICRCTQSLTCCRHFKDLCLCPISSRRLRLRYSDEVLRAFAERVNKRAHLPSVWEAKFASLIRSCARPSLKALRSILAEGESLSFDMPQLAGLRAFVQEACAWVEAASNLLAKRGVKRKIRSVEHPSLISTKRLESPPSPGHVGSQQRSVSQVFAVLSAADGLAFDAPEVGQLRELARRINLVISRMTTLMLSHEQDQMTLDLKEADAIQHEADDLGYRIPQYAQFLRAVSATRWRSHVKQLNIPSLSYEDLGDLLREGRAHQIQEDDASMIHLSRYHDKAEDWKKRAEDTLEQTWISREKVQLLLNEDGPVVQELWGRMSSLLKRHATFEKDAKSLLAKCHGLQSVKMCEVLSLLKEGESISILSPEIEAMQGIVERDQQWRNSLATSLNCKDRAEAVMSLLTALAESCRLSFVEGDDWAENWHSDEVNEELTENIDQRYCFCRQKYENSPMVACDFCSGKQMAFPFYRALTISGWYHLKCLGISKKSVAEEESTYACPLCDSEGNQKYGSRTPFQVIIGAYAESEQLLAEPTEKALLAEIKALIKPFVTAMQGWLREHEANQRRSLMQALHILRKMYGSGLAEESIEAQCHAIVALNPPSKTIVSESVAHAAHLDSSRPRRIPIPANKVDATFLHEVARVCGRSDDRYCVCLSTDDSRPMVACDEKSCQRWFHLDCVGMRTVQIKSTDLYLCAGCCVRKELPYPFATLVIQDKAGFPLDMDKALREKTKPRRILVGTRLDLKRALALTLQEYRPSSQNGPRSPAVPSPVSSTRKRKERSRSPVSDADTLHQSQTSTTSSSPVRKAIADLGEYARRYTTSRAKKYSSFNSVHSGPSLPLSTLRKIDGSPVVDSSQESLESAFLSQASYGMPLVDDSSHYTHVASAQRIAAL